MDSSFQFERIVKIASLIKDLFVFNKYSMQNEYSGMIEEVKGYLFMLDDDSLTKMKEFYYQVLCSTYSSTYVAVNSKFLA